VEKLRKDIEAIRLKLSNRIDQLGNYVYSHREAGNFSSASICNNKRRLLLMIINDIDEALKE